MPQKYCSVPLICLPILYTTSSLKWRGGLYSNMQLVSSISPPPQSLRERYIHFQSSCLHKNTVTKAFYTKQLIQDREYCSWTSRLQSFVVSLHRRRAASSTRGQEHSRRLCCSCPQEQQYCRSCTTGNFQSLLVPPAQEWQ